ncbi:replication initiator protein A [Microvirga sp. HBU67558]|uniref:replication initiator protein A n=1 Tax=Microvirga TaxID=186650 RepID=UPI001B364721|nr:MULTISPECIES: replication initiator protein A [unclassified Microvirga]MBQ0819143.1 replication initiator protein A [Microvirga sp. HBU67558]
MVRPEQGDLFIVTSIDPPLRDNRDAMEHPFLSLQKRRTKPIIYDNGSAHIEVHAPEKFGIATIWDWDIIIGLSSQINDGIEAGRKPSPRISFAPYNLLRSIGRNTGGKDYRELAAAIRRLRMTTIITNVRSDDGAGLERPFSWLSDYAIPTTYTSTVLTPDDHQGDADPTRPWEVELPGWLYNAIIRRRDILAVHPAYFSITSGIGRALYRLARKSVPATDPQVWNFRMDTLHHRLGVTSSRREFARQVREIAAADTLPEYTLHVRKHEGHETVTFSRNKSKPPRPRRGIYRP